MAEYNAIQTTVCKQKLSVFKFSYSKAPSIYITKDYHQFYIQNYIHIYYSVKIS